MEALLSAIANLFTINSLIGLAVGVCGGMVIGALPGLSATMGIALLIPVTYGMDPSAALIMLASIYTSAIYGGSISAILIHTPGTPSSAATCLDGYPMTQKGEALHAIGLSTVSSCIGGFISAIALLVIAPLLARISLAFSSSEYFLIAIFGQRRRDQQQRDSTDKAADTGRNRRQTDGVERLALLGHGIAVQTGGGGAGGAGCVDQNGGDGAAVDCGGIDGRQHDQCGRGVHAIRNGDQQSDTHGGGQAGQSTDDHAAAHADSQAEERVGGKQIDKTAKQSFHLMIPSFHYIRIPLGRGTLSWMTNRK